MICGDLCEGYCVGQWVGSCQITRNSIIWKLIKIIQFCLKFFVFCLHSHPIPATQPPTPLDYTQISNNSIGLESIKIIQLYLKIWIPLRLLHSWVGWGLELCQITNNQINDNLIKIIQLSLTIFDLWIHSHLWVVGWMDILLKPPQPLYRAIFWYRKAVSGNACAYPSPL